MREIYALGVGAATFNFIELASACGYEVVALYHYNGDRTGQIDHGYEILGSFEDLFNQDLSGKNFLLTMGDMNIRKELYDKIVSKGGAVPTLIHPSAEISKFTSISSNGVLIDSQTIIQSDCRIEEGACIRAQVLIGHHTTISPYVFVAPKSIIGARILVREFAFIGLNATLISTKVKEIGARATIGAGAVVTKPVSDGQIVAGNPARPIFK